MKLEVSFPNLDAQRRRMGAPLSNWTPDPRTRKAREQVLSDLARGVALRGLDDVKSDVGGLLTYKGEQILLYIKDNTHVDPKVLENNPSSGKRFHITECGTLENMRRQGRFERYVITNRTDGMFRVDWRDHDTGECGETELALRVCKNCLSNIGYQGYTFGRDDIWENFDINQFFMYYATFFRSKPGRWDTEADMNWYTRDWSRVSEAIKRKRLWTCEQCKVDLQSVPKFLHCHHINGVKTDNNDRNLMILCALCHVKQPGHGHMKVRPADEQRIRSLRREQGLR